VIGLHLADAVRGICAWVVMMSLNLKAFEACIDKIADGHGFG
jgi:hypothetical protein